MTAYRVVKTSTPGLRLVETGKGYVADFRAAPDEDGWAVARQLPQLIREAIAAHQKHKAHCRQLHTVYPCRWRRR